MFGAGDDAADSVLPQWDKVVDVVCTGSGAGGLASAIASKDAGLDVFVADSCENLHDGISPGMLVARPDGLHRRMGIDVADGQTNDLLDALTGDLGPLSCWLRDTDVPIRVMAEEDSSKTGDQVETFFGSQLRKWAVRCLASPYGVFYSRVSHRTMTSMKSRNGETVMATVLGAFEAGTRLPGPPLAGWLLEQALDRDIEVMAASPLERLVFEDGEVVGAVVTTPTGPCAVRGRNGVVVATGGYHVNPTWPSFALEEHAAVQVCMVSKPASRFGRLELLTSETSVRRPRLPRTAAASDALGRRKVHG